MNPQSNPDSRYIHDMFEHLAPRYDLFNHLTSFGLATGWRREALKPLKPGMRVLDLGCGTGDLAIDAIKKIGSSGEVIGLDFSEYAIREAKRKSNELLSQFLRFGFSCHFHYFLSDLEARLPFTDNTFTKICCSLVVSYVNDGVSVLKELMRVLSPGGQAVVTSLKPYNDLSLIYRNFVDVAETEEEIVEEIGRAHV